MKELSHRYWPAIRSVQCIPASLTGGGGKLGISNCSEDIAGRIVLRKMTQADLEIVSDVAMLANPFANKERYRKFLTPQVEAFPDITFVAATHCGEPVIGYVTADIKEDEACIEDIAVAKPWQGKSCSGR